MAGLGNSGSQRLGLPPEPFHLLVEVASLEPEHGRGPGHASARPEESRLDLPPLELPDRFAQSDPAYGGAVRAGKHGVDLLGPDGGASGHDPEPLHEIPELAHVSRKAVVLEQL